VTCRDVARRRVFIGVIKSYAAEFICAGNESLFDVIHQTDYTRDNETSARTCPIIPVFVSRLHVTPGMHRNVDPGVLSIARCVSHMPSKKKKKKKRKREVGNMNLWRLVGLLYEDGNSDSVMFSEICIYV